MPRTTKQLVQAVGTALAFEEAQLAEIRARQLVEVHAQAATGTGHINDTFGLGGRFRLVFVRCHFAGTVLDGPLHLELDSFRGPAFDTRLFTITRAGPNHDVNLRIAGGDTAEPSAWTFQPNDAVRINWQNLDPGNITWGLEVGLAPAS